MQLSPKIKNKSVIHSLLLKPRVGDVVTSSGIDYINISGINSEVSNADNWYKITSGTTPKSIEVNKSSLNIEGDDPNFYIDLSTDGLPDFPNSIAVYIDIAADGNYVPVNPVSFNPITKILEGMNDPGEFPNQLIKILVIGII